MATTRGSLEILGLDRVIGSNKSANDGGRHQLQAQQTGGRVRANDRNSRGGKQRHNTAGSALQMNNSYDALKQEVIGSVCFQVGDSNVEHQEWEFKQRKANTKVLCRPVATVQMLANQVIKLSTKKDTLIMVIQEGIENLQLHTPGQLFRSEALMEKYKNFIKAPTKPQWYYNGHFA